ncbi:hypothetical protein D910_07714 [Dendroctonus ponderosae]|uniref:C2H2-type domain-containing protein n=1 Tax=Dendroctonus ponderosae TaxID=77166 RepID=U4UK50_DENPD|nr:hypothetical protein D910_07714 [Dendroctonus ponderosae]
MLNRGLASLAHLGFKVIFSFIIDYDAIEETEYISAVAHDHDYAIPPAEASPEWNKEQSDLPTHTVNELYQCEFCERILKSQHFLDNHLKLMHLQECNVCHICGKGFLCSSVLKKHQDLMHPNGKIMTKRRYACLEIGCDKAYTRKKALVDHQRTKHMICLTNEPLSYSCEICQKVILSRENLQIHIRAHNGERPFKCKVCGKAFHANKYLKQHSVVHTGEKRFVCKVCDKKFSQGGSLFVHTRKFHPDLTKKKNMFSFITEDDEIVKTEITYEFDFDQDCVELLPEEACSECNMVFYARPDLISHIESEHQNQCEFCGKIFKGKHLLDNHIKLVHLQEPNNVFCEFCGKGFLFWTVLKKHKQLMHPNGKIKTRMGYPCLEIGCDKAYTRKRALVYHQRTRHLICPPNEPLSYSCEICQKVILSRANLQIHLRAHTGERPFKCDVCGKAFHAKKYLKEHNVVHTGEKPFVCKICDKKFSQAGSLFVHTRKCHPDVAQKKDTFSFIIENDGLEETEITYVVDPYHDYLELLPEEACPECNMVFYARSDMLTHIENEHRKQNDNYQCEFCGKILKRKHLLDNHIKLMHLKKYNVFCEICGKGFLFMSVLNKHRELIHQNRKIISKITFPCREVGCDKAYTTKTALLYHQKTRHLLCPPNEPLSYSCEICQKVILSRANFRIHLRAHTGERPFKCDVCGKAFHANKYLKEHSVVHTGEKPFVCKVCDKKFSQGGSLFVHTRKCHPDVAQKNFDPFDAWTESQECPLCNRVFPSNVALLKHKIVCDPTCLYKICKVCNKFIKKTKLDRHIAWHKVKRKTQLYSCEKCDKTFRSLQYLKLHREKVHENKGIQYPCDVCGKRFSTKYRAEYHKKTIHLKDFNVHCEQCGRGFLYLTELTTHVRRVHDKEVNIFYCTVANCRRGFRSNAALKYHLQTEHSDNKPQHICAQCNKTFHHISLYKRHLSRHTDIKRFSCDTCGNQYTSKHTLEIHLRTHTGERPFVCEHCGNSFTARKFLKVHLVVHTKEKPYACLQCSKTFTQKGSLNIHVKKDHTTLPIK